MKNKILVIILAVIFSFIGISNVNASDNLIRTETKDKVIFIKDKNDGFSYSWTFNKDDYKKNEFDFDLGIRFASSQKQIEKLINDDIKVKYVSFNYHGNLPSSSNIKIPVDDKFKDGEKLNLYYYNDKRDKIELVETSVDVINGYVTFEIDHCSDYFLTLSIIKEAENNNNNGIIIVGMIIIIVGLIGYTLIKNRK